MDRKRFAMVTIGQAPRADLVPDLRAELEGLDVEVLEFGALDGLGEDEIEALAPGPDEPRLVTRLRDGREVTLAKTKVEALLEALLLRLDAEVMDAIVLLCTGRFEGLNLRSPLIESQVVVDETLATLAGSVDCLGILVPHREQIAEFHKVPAAGHRLRFSHASPYGDRRFAEAGRELSQSGIIVMHCMGYCEAMRQQVAEASGRPVLLARRIVASALRDLAQLPKEAGLRGAGQRQTRMTGRE